MRVKIGPYTNWIGPYQLTNWMKHVIGEKRYEQFTDSKTFEKVSDWTMPMFKWIDSKKKRKVEVHIDNYDIWGMDSTLALIILPMLKLLKEHKQGAPVVDDADVPKRLKSSSAKPLTQKEKDCGHTDELFFARWDYVLDEMIWAFEQKTIDWQDQYHSGEIDMQFKPLDDEPGYSEMVKGPNDTHEFDRKGFSKHSKRMVMGYKLFGKYYQALWD
jgi:hypothetical protein